MKTTVLAGLALATLASAACAQETGNLSFLATPMALKQLEGGGYFRIKIVVAGPSDAGASSPMGGILGMLGGMLGGAAGGLQDMMWPILNGVAFAGPDTYYTKLAETTLGTERYVMVYQPEGKPIPMDAMSGSKPPIPKPMTAETRLSPSLINVRQIVRIRDAKPFSLANELKESAQKVKEIEKFAAEQEKKPGAELSPIAPDRRP